ncbi:Spy/CpxP family protein refolding chaperone [Pseudomonas typographi]|uniref:LTXXQ domain protein n=1 Tax=Pseudomonas typographi TaxID=2715964 RepID=A0ABR7Z9L9_9PSED|nr:Spy/CpxP family protein refolding chaperone [Pseudomonas typographi]MBD1554943.1 LTXXQ domain protein [Pseudomonas typographi]MBD1590026.1 LTXXQ domain protein [Pseudomonas typographi]MBD1602058.1 LTXXQ domain protein [Pseudomonas typographi]
MRKTLIALMFATTLPAVAMAAAPEAGPAPFAPGPMMEGGHRGGPDMFGTLDLSREQRLQVRKLMGEQMQQRHQITEAFLNKLPAADQKAMQDQLKASEDKTRSGIRAVLNPEQQKQFDEIKQQQDQRRAEWAEFQAWKAQKDKKGQ